MKIIKQNEPTIYQFQKDSVDHIINYYNSYNNGKRKKAFLLADETGLGKTIVDREVVKQLYKQYKKDSSENENRKAFRLLYICSNLDLAQTNLNKLKWKDIDCKEPKSDRLSMISKDLIASENNDGSSPIEYYSITPAISLQEKGGNHDEQKYCREIAIEFDKRWKKGREKTKKKQAAKTVEQFYKLSVNKPDIIGKAWAIYGCLEKLYSEMEKSDPDFEGIDKGIINRKSYFNYFTDYKEYNFTWNDYDFSKDGWKNQFADEFASRILKKTIYLWRRFDVDYYKIEYLEALFNRNDHNGFGLTGIQIKILHDAIKALPDKFWDDLENKIINDNGDQDKEKKQKNILEILRRTGKLKENENLESDKINILSETQIPCRLFYVQLYESLKRELENTILKILTGEDNITDEASIEAFRKDVLSIVRGMALRQAFIIKRRLAGYISLCLLEPDIVIIDEMQCYPMIFEGKGKNVSVQDAVNNEESENDNESISVETDNVRLVMDTILDSQDDSSKKLLMLSATPYAYRNIITVNTNEDELEENRFLDHLVGIEEIIKYLGNNNGVPNAYDEWEGLYKSYNDFIINLSSSGKDTDEEEIAKKRDKFKELNDKLSRLLISIGVSRVERKILPDEYSVTEKMDYVDITASDLLYFFKDLTKERLNLSCCRDKKESDNLIEGGKLLGIEHNGEAFEYEENSRVKGFIEACLPKGAERLLFIPPTKPHYELSGAFEGLGDYSKTILFSAYNKVPDDLYYVIKNEIERRDKEKPYYESIKKLFNNTDDSFIEEKVEKIYETTIEEKVEKIYKTAKENYDEQQKYDYFKLLKQEDRLSDDEKRYMGSVYAYFKDNFDQGFDNTCKQIYKLFLNRHAAVCIGYNKESLDSDDDYKVYVQKIDEYCYSGNIRAVLDEFLYLFCFENNYIIEENGNNSNESHTVDSFLEYSLKTAQIPYFASSYRESIVNKHSSKCVSGNDLEFVNIVKHFQSPFYPFILTMTSVAQEGFDFHWYCNRIIHWNVSGTPIAFIQREGRINRCNCLGVRHNLCKVINKLAENDDNINKELSGFDGKYDIWEKMFDIAEEQEEKVVELFGSSSDASLMYGLYPHWIIPYDDDCKAYTDIKRGTFFFKYSEEDYRWKALMKSLHYYKGLLGATTHNDITDEKIMEAIKDIKIDLYPPIKNDQDKS